MRQPSGPRFHEHPVGRIADGPHGTGRRQGGFDHGEFLIGHRSAAAAAGRIDGLLVVVVPPVTPA
jgi:hypothetical protein